MIKLNDTVSFVTSTGQQLVGVVDAFRGQGMADITTTDGMQLRQAVSALSPVCSNPMRTNPMRTNTRRPTFARINPGNELDNSVDATRERMKRFVMEHRTRAIAGSQKYFLTDLQITTIFGNDNTFSGIRFESSFEEIKRGVPHMQNVLDKLVDDMRMEQLQRAIDAEVDRVCAERSGEEPHDSRKDRKALIAEGESRAVELDKMLDQTRMQRADTLSKLQKALKEARNLSETLLEGEFEKRGYSYASLEKKLSDRRALAAALSADMQRMGQQLDVWEDEARQLTQALGRAKASLTNMPRHQECMSEDEYEEIVKAQRARLDRWARELRTNWERHLQARVKAAMAVARPDEEKSEAERGREERHAAFDAVIKRTEVQRLIAPIEAELKGVRHKQQDLRNRIEAAQAGIASIADPELRLQARRTLAKQKESLVQVTAQVEQVEARRVALLEQIAKSMGLIAKRNPPPTLEEAWRVIGVDAKTPFKQARRAYRAKAKLTHPDKFQSAAEKSEANAQFLLLSSAWAVLEAHYDKSKPTQAKATTAPPAPAPAAPAPEPPPGSTAAALVKPLPDEEIVAKLVVPDHTERYDDIYVPINVELTPGLMFKKTLSQEDRPYAQLTGIGKASFAVSSLEFADKFKLGERFDKLKDKVELDPDALSALAQTEEGKALAALSDAEKVDTLFKLSKQQFFKSLSPKIIEAKAAWSKKAAEKARIRWRLEDPNLSLTELAKAVTQLRAENEAYAASEEQRKKQLSHDQAQKPALQRKQDKRRREQEAEAQRSIEAAARTDANRKLRELRERSQGQSIANLASDPNRAQYLVVDDPLRSSPNSEVICGNALDGKAYLIALSREERNIKTYITWRNLGFESMDDIIAGTPSGDPSYVYTPRTQTRQGMQTRAYETKPVTLEFLLNHEPLIKSNFNDRVKVEGISRQEADLYRSDLRPKDKDANTRTNLLLLETAFSNDDGQLGVNDTLTNSIAGRAGELSGPGADFIVAVDFDRRTGRGRGYQDYTMPALTPGPWSPDNPVLYVDQKGEVFGFVVSGKISTVDDMLSAPFGLFSRYSEKGRNPYFSWVKEKRNMLEGDLSCPDDTAVQALNALKSGTTALTSYVKALSLLQRNFSAYGCASTWLGIDAWTTPLGACTLAAMRGLEQGSQNLTPQQLIQLEGLHAQKVRDSDTLTSVIETSQEVERNIRHWRKEVSTKQQTLNNFDRGVILIREDLRVRLRADTENALYAAREQLAQLTAQSIELTAQIDELRRKLRSNEENIEALLGRGESVRRISRVLEQLKSSREVAQRQRQDTELLYQRVVNTLRGLAFTHDRIDEERFVSAYRGRPEADFSIFHDDNERLSNYLHTGIDQISVLARKAAEDPTTDANPGFVGSTVDMFNNVVPRTISRLAENALEKKMVTRAYVRKGSGRGRSETVQTYDATPKFAFRYADALVARISTEDAQARMMALIGNPKFLLFYIIVRLLKGDGVVEILGKLSDQLGMPSSDRFSKGFNFMIRRVARVYAEGPNYDAFIALAKKGGVDQSELSAFKDELLEEMKELDDDADLMAYVDKFRSGTGEERHYDLDLIADGLRTKCFSFANKYKENLIKNHDSVAHEAAIDCLQYLVERQIVMMREVPFYPPAMNPTAVVVMLQFYDALSDTRLKTSLSAAMTKVETLTEPPQYLVLPGATFQARSSVISALGPTPYQDIYVVTQEVVPKVGVTPVETSTLPPGVRLVGTKATTVSTSSSRSTEPETARTVAVAVEFIVKFGTAAKVEDARQRPAIAKVIKDVKVLPNDRELFDHLEKVKQRYPKAALPPIQPTTSGAQVGQAETTETFAERLRDAYTAMELAIQGSPKSQKVVTPGRREGAREKGFEVFYTYNPLLFELTRLFLPSMRAGRKGQRPWAEWYRLVGDADTGTTKQVLNYPELADSVDAIGLYGYLLANLRLAAVHYEHAKMGRKAPKTYAELAEAMRDYFTDMTQVEKWWPFLRPGVFSPADRALLDLANHWTETFSDLLNEEALPGVMATIKRRAVVGLTDAARLKTEGVHLEGTAPGPGGRREVELHRTPTNTARPSMSTTVHMPGPIGAIARLFERIAPQLLLKLNGLSPAQRQEFATATDYWKGLADGDARMAVSASYPDKTSTGKPLPAEESYRSYRLLREAFEPSRGNVYGILEAILPEGARPSDQLRMLPQNERPDLNDSSQINKAMIPWLARTLTKLNVETGRPHPDASAMSQLSPSMAITPAEAEDTYLAVSQRQVAQRREILDIIARKLRQ